MLCADWFARRRPERRPSRSMIFTAASPITKMVERSMRKEKSHQDPEIVTAERAAKDKRTADILWWILMVMRFVIPGYMLYVVYLYWTAPMNPNLQGPH